MRLPGADTSSRDYGLRAQLLSDSLLTGKMKVFLRCDASKPGYTVGGKLPYAEIPTVRSPLSQARERLEGLDLEGIVYDTHRAIKGLSDLLNAAETKAAIVSLHESLRNISSLATNLDAQVSATSDLLAARSDAALAAIDETLSAARTVLTNLDVQISPALQGFSATSQELGRMLEPRSPFRHELDQALRQVAAASRSLRQLSEYLERHPEALVRGKRNSP
jgi:paraquat-inducible protein B